MLHIQLLSAMYLLRFFAYLSFLRHFSHFFFKSTVACSGLNTVPLVVYTLSFFTLCPSSQRVQNRTIEIERQDHRSYCRSFCLFWTCTPLPKRTCANSREFECYPLSLPLQLPFLLNDVLSQFKPVLIFLSSSARSSSA